ncbi:MAG TPA: hemerythrin domain-containing protein [Polyangiaceae bacterium]|jgi:hemerythrin-like domain-containing protein
MLHSIRTRPAEPPSNEPSDLLLACHARLRHFSELAVALARRGDLDVASIVDGSERLLRYFRLALPLHEADEEESLAPALIAHATPEQVDALERMRAEHVAIHDVLAELFPLWEATAADARAPHRTRALPHAERLSSVLRDHLALEESVVFPSMRALADSERKALVLAMRARRDGQPPHSVEHSVGQALPHKHE